MSARSGATKHFDVQQSIDRAVLRADHALAFGRWRRLIELHTRDAVSVGRRWQWPVAMRDTARDVVDGGERSEASGYIGTSDVSLGR
jgi:hypothetical protein